MLDAKLTIEIPGLAAALESLAAAISGKRDAAGLPHVGAQPGAANQTAQAPTYQAPISSGASFVPQQAPTAQATYVPAGMPPVQAAAGPAPTAYPSGPAAPTAAAPAFDVAQVSKAGADMIGTDRGKMGALMGLLQQFGVPAISELKPEQLGPFATALRGLGAKI